MEIVYQGKSYEVIEDLDESDYYIVENGPSETLAIPKSDCSCWKDVTNYCFIDDAVSTKDQGRLSILHKRQHETVDIFHPYQHEHYDVSLSPFRVLYDGGH